MAPSNERHTASAPSTPLSKGLATELRGSPRAGRTPSLASLTEGDEAPKPHAFQSKQRSVSLSNDAMPRRIESGDSSADDDGDDSDATEEAWEETTKDTSFALSTKGSPETNKVREHLAERRASVGAALRAALPSKVLPPPVEVLPVDAFSQAAGRYLAGYDRSNIPDSEDSYYSQGPPSIASSNAPTPLARDFAQAGYSMLPPVSSAQFSSLQPLAAPFHPTSSYHYPTPQHYHHPQQQQQHYAYAYPPFYQEPQFYAYPPLAPPPNYPPPPLLQQAMFRPQLPQPYRASTHGTTQGPRFPPGLSLPPAKPNALGLVVNEAIYRRDSTISTATSGLESVEIVINQLEDAGFAFPHPHIPSLSGVKIPTPIQEELELESNVDATDAAKGVPKDVVCTGCGAPACSSFVALQDCDHVICATCLNALVNSAAHTPPRPMKCFACAEPVKSFGLAFEVAAQKGMLAALRESLLNGEAKRTSAPTSAANSPVHSRAPTTTSPANSRFTKPGFRTPSGSISYGSPSRARAPYPTHASPRSRRASVSSPRGGRTRSVSPRASRSRSGTFSSTEGVRDWSDETMDPSTMFTPQKNDREVPIELSNGSFRSPVPPEVLKTLRKPIEWPVVRLDNIPWDVSVAEVEAWLPEGTLAPYEECILAVHILCNRLDGRTLNQAYLECCSIPAAREIVRSRDGQKLRNRPVHVSIANQGEILGTIFPSWEAGFNGLDAKPSPVSGPLILQTELTGLINLCRLNTYHSSKVKERAYMNIVTIVQKFPWHQLETYNSKQIVRLYNTSCAAIEVLQSIRTNVPEYCDIISIFGAVVNACPVFRPAQKTKFLKKCEASPSLARQPSNAKLGAQKRGQPIRASFFSPPSLRDPIVGVSMGPSIPSTEEGSPTPSAILDLARPHPRPLTSSPPKGLSKQRSIHLFAPQPLERKLNKSTSTPHLGGGSDSPTKSRSRANSKSQKSLSSKGKRASIIGADLGVDEELIKRVAAQLGVSVA